MRRHRRLAWRPRYGGFGSVTFPYFLGVELFGPIIEAIGLVALAAAALLGVVEPAFVLLFLLISYGWGVLLSVSVVLLDEVVSGRYARWRDRGLLVVWALLENLGYRQCTLYWRLRGLVRYLRGSQEWGTMTRRGFQTEAR